MPVEMLLKRLSGEYETVIVYHIYQDLLQDGIACAVCWCPFSNSWYQCPLAELVPILPSVPQAGKSKVNKTVLNEII